MVQKIERKNEHLRLTKENANQLKKQIEDEKNKMRKKEEEVQSLRECLQRSSKGPSSFDNLEENSSAIRNLSSKIELEEDNQNLKDKNKQLESQIQVLRHSLI